MIFRDLGFNLVKGRKNERFHKYYRLNCQVTIDRKNIEIFTLENLSRINFIFLARQNLFRRPEKKYDPLHPRTGIKYNFISNRRVKLALNFT